MLVAEGLRVRIAARTFQSGGRRVLVSDSIGIAILWAHHPALPQEHRLCRQGLYRAKADGRNRVEVYCLEWIRSSREPNAR